HLQVLRSFPTRRSSDLVGVTIQFLTPSAKAYFILKIILQPLLALLYTLILVALLKSTIGSTVLKPLQAYGRMGMSNYLGQTIMRSEEHTSELQSRFDLV